MRTPVFTDNAPTIREMRSWAPQPARRDSASTSSHRQGPEPARERPTTRPPSRAEEVRSESFGAVISDPTVTAISPRGQVLVVAADGAVASAIQCALDDVYDVVECSDPRDAVLGIVRGCEYDVILCDRDVPFVSAEAFRDQVAAVNPALAERVLFLGAGMREAPERSSYVSKPLDVDTLRMKVAELVRLGTMAPVAPF